jgi:opacity protein-like surface antigen
MFLGAIAVAAIAVPARAGEDGTVAERGMSLGPRVAYFDPKQSGADSVWFGGAQLRFYLNKIFAIEGSVDYRQQDAGSNLTVRTMPVQASLLAYLLYRKPVAVFLLGGGGWYFTKFDVDNGPGDHTENRFGPHAGGGVQFFLSDAWSIDGTWRYIWLQRVKSDNTLSDENYDPSGQMVTAALNYHF